MNESVLLSAEQAEAIRAIGEKQKSLANQLASLERTLQYLGSLYAKEHQMEPGERYNFNGNRDGSVRMTIIRPEAAKTEGGEGEKTDEELDAEAQGAVGAPGGNGGDRPDRSASGSKPAGAGDQPPEQSEL